MHARALERSRRRALHHQLPLAESIPDVVNERPIRGADSDTYVIKPSDAGHGIGCIVTAERVYTEEAWTYATWTPAAMSVVPFDDEVAPGADDGYTVTLRNPNPLPTTAREFNFLLPTGFTYRTGTTSGALTADPIVSGRSLEWSDDVVVPAAGEVTFSFGVATSTVAGDHFVGSVYAPSNSNQVYIESRDDTARITVAPPFDETTCTI